MVRDNLKKLTDEFFINKDNKFICVICGAIPSVYKECLTNLKSHLINHHEEELRAYYLEKNINKTFVLPIKKKKKKKKA